jgi:glycosyltransferase involved in cell wall biosynthesis
MARTIDSILSNSLDKIQLVLVIDGSPDNALEIAKRYEKEY